MRPLLLAVMLFAPATAWTQAPALDGTCSTLSGTFFGRKAIKSFSVTRTERGR